jgi:hypothetical protein
VDLDAILADDHPARSVWAFVQALDLAPLYAQIKSLEGGRGAPAIDPAILRDSPVSLAISRSDFFPRLCRRRIFQSCPW